MAYARSAAGNEDDFILQYHNIALMAQHPKNNKG
jgi:hypothetical protein